jgi:hypothetical protein
MVKERFGCNSQTGFGYLSQNIHTIMYKTGGGWLPLQDHNARQRRTAARCSCTWNIWKERNTKIFEEKLNSPMQVFNLAKEEMARVACALWAALHPWI